MDAILDVFNPNQYTFFVIGDNLKCKPCRQVHEILEFLVEDTEEEISVREWRYDMSKKKMVDDMQQKWVDREKTRDPKYAEWKSIPQIWYNGLFIGGKSELMEVLRNKY